MKNAITAIVIILLTITLPKLQAQNNAYEIKKNILQSFSAEGVRTLIVKLDQHVSVKVWQQNMISVETSLIPIKAKFKAIKILADSGHYDVLTVNTKDKFLVYDNPNKHIVLFKGKKQLFRIEYTIYVPEHMAVMDVFRNDLLKTPLVSNLKYRTTLMRHNAE